MGFSAGYGFPVASQNISMNLDIGINQSTKSILKGSFGQGINLNCFYGLLVAKNVSLEANFSFIRSNPINSVYIKDTSYQEKLFLQARMLKVSPVFRFNIPDQFMYFKVGPLFRLAGNIIATYQFNDYLNNSVTDSDWRYSHGFSIGGFAAIGLNRTLNEHFVIFGEAAVNVQSWAPKKGNVVAYKVNGTDMIETLNVAQKQTNFVANYTDHYHSKSGWEPSTELKQYFPFSNAALMVGIQYNFLHKKSE
jgi:hypothetical protein